MPTYFARTPRRRKGAVRWKATTPKLARLIGIPVKVREKPSTEEHDAQVALFDGHIRVRLVAGAVAFAIPNGGHRAKREAGKIKAEGGAAGVPDIFVLYRRQAYFLEMKKAKGGRVSKEQKIMMARLVGAGAICAVAAETGGDGGMSLPEEEIPPAVATAVDQVAGESLTWLRPGPHGLDTITRDQMTEEERLLALTILQSAMQGR